MTAEELQAIRDRYTNPYSCHNEVAKADILELWAEVVLLRGEVSNLTRIRWAAEERGDRLQFKLLAVPIDSIKHVFRFCDFIGWGVPEAEAAFAVVSKWLEGQEDTD